MSYRIVQTYHNVYEFEEGWEYFQPSRLKRVVDRMLRNRQPLKCFCCGLSPTHVIQREFKSDTVINFAIANITGAKVVAFNVDHIIPVSLGGRNMMENLRLSCEICNTKRSANMSDDDKLFLMGNPHLCKDPYRTLPTKKVPTVSRTRLTHNSFYYTKGPYKESDYVY